MMTTNFTESTKPLTGDPAPVIRELQKQVAELQKALNAAERNIANLNKRTA